MLPTLQPIFTSTLYWMSLVVVIVYVYIKYVLYGYWKKLKVPHEDPTVPFGNCLPALRGQLSLGDTVKANYNKLKDHKFHGMYMFHQPVLIINDPELLRLVLIKEFNKFPDRGGFFNESVDPLSARLFFLPGERWRKLRNKLTPTFTSGKIKGMFPLLKEIGTELIKATELSFNKSEIVDVKDLAARYTTDTISSIAFGFNCNSLENPTHDFRKYGEMAFQQHPFVIAAGFFAPSILQLFRVPFFRAEVCKYFTKTFTDVLNYRKENSIVRNDFMNLLIQLMEKDQRENDSDKIRVIDAVAQAFVFFIAGFETTSSTVTWALYELAKHPEIQRKVIEEVDKECNSEQGITYDVLSNGMNYLHMVFCETLRMHPSLPFLNRLCVEDYKIPNSNYIVKKGTAVMISVTGLHHDPRYYPDPDQFIPERFSKENMAKRDSIVYLPFGDGPRMCIGNRFGAVQSKMALVSLLTHYEFSVCEKTQIPARYTKTTDVQAPEGPIYLRLRKRK